MKNKRATCVSPVRALVLAVVLCAGAAFGQGVRHPNLVGWWAGEGTAADVSGAGNNGTWSGTAAYAAGRFGRGMSGAGNGHIIIGNPEALQFADGDFSVAAWFSSASLDTGQFNGIISNKAFNNGFELRYFRSSVSGLYGCGFIFNSAERSLIAEPAPGVWYHVGFSRIGGTLYGYVNGAQVTSAAVTGSISDLWEIGRARETNIRRFWGSLDEVMVFSAALPSHEIRRLRHGFLPMGRY